MADIQGLIGVTPQGARPGAWGGKSDGNGGAALVLALILSVASCVVFALALAWVNSERTDLGYDVRELHKLVEASEAYQAKLEVERDRLLDPRLLDRKAREFGLQDARPGQIRRMSGADDM